MSSETFGMLLNKDGQEKYYNPDAPEKVIRYVTRTNGMDKRDLISWGGSGILECSGIESVAEQFYYVQKSHTRRGNFGKYMNHEIFSFSPKGEYVISKNNIDIDQIARLMAQDIYEQDHCQVVYGIHNPDKSDPHLHIHFAINAVNYYTGGKRHENMTQTGKRNQRFNKMISDELSGKKAEN